MSDVSSSLANLSCNMVFVLPKDFMAKEGQPSSMIGDVEVSSDTPVIASVLPVTSNPVQVSPNSVASSSQIPSIVTAYGPSPMASVLFERPDLLMTQRLRPPRAGTLMGKGGHLTPLD